jgi:transcriptional regulator with XRE-family HTH domain
MTADQLQAWRKKFGYSQGELAKALGVHAVTVARWEAQMREIPPFLDLALETIERRIKAPLMKAKTEPRRKR